MEHACLQQLTSLSCDYAQKCVTLNPQTSSLKLNSLQSKSSVRMSVSHAQVELFTYEPIVTHRYDVQVYVIKIV